MKRLFLTNVLIGLHVFAPLTAGAADSGKALDKSVVKIYSAIQRPNYSMPWQPQRPNRANGSGFIIRKRRILTNAHVVSDTRFVQVQKKGDSRRYVAEVLFAGHDCDLAVLRVADESFFDGTEPVSFAQSVPELNDEVLVFGFPMGGDRLSVTRGIVSRIDYSVYSHSGIDQHLVVQVDAAINPGNSGGPVVFDGKVVGLAFQALAWAENIGYAIPLPVINRFLDDIDDGKYNGYPELGIAFLNTRNRALRAHLGLAPEQTGIVVEYVDPFGSGAGVLVPGDVITEIDGHKIDNEGRIAIDGNRIVFFELLERKQRGESVNLTVIRKGTVVNLKVELDSPEDPYAFRMKYDRSPRYLVFAGLVFTPLTRNYVKTIASGSLDKREQQLFYITGNAKLDELYEDRQDFIVLSGRLPHPVNTYAEGFVEGVVVEINNVKIHGLKDVEEAFEKPENGYHVVKFAGMQDFLVLDANSADASNEQIRRRYSLNRLQNLDAGAP